MTHTVCLIASCICISSLTAQKVFTSLDSLLSYATQKSITVQSNDIKIRQAKQAKVAALLSIPDPTGNSGLNYTDNTTLPVSLFPDASNPGKYSEIRVGQKYSTQFSQNTDIKIVNLAGWENWKLAKINIDLANSNRLLGVKSLEENIASNYYNILNLQAQIVNSERNLAISDTLFQIVQAKQEKGLVKPQDVNDSKVAVLNNQEQIKQLEFLLKQYYLSLKTLCDIPEQEQIVIAQKLPQNPESEASTVVLNALAISNSLLKEKYAWSNYRQSVKSNLPTLSFTQSNSYTLYNQDFKLFDGKWYKGASIGFKISIPMPNANSIGNRTKAKYDYELARKITEQETIKANLVQTQLQVDYDKALSQARSNKEIFELRKDSYQKNKFLYEQGLLGLDQTLNSFTAMVNAGYNLTTSIINVQLAQAKININNKLK